MHDIILTLFLEVRERFADINHKVSLLKPYFELHFSSPGRAAKLTEFRDVLGFEPELLFTGSENVYGISVIYAIDDKVTRGIIAHEFAEVLALDKGIEEHEIIDEICVARGFGRELLLALQNILPGRVERSFLNRKDLEQRITRLRTMFDKDNGSA
jgi:hypothetical protein